mgnify:FL=1
MHDNKSKRVVCKMSLSMTVEVSLDYCGDNSVEFPILGNEQQVIDLIRSHYTNINDTDNAKSEHYHLTDNDLDDIADRIKTFTRSDAIVTKTSLRTAAAFLNVNAISPCDVYIYKATR